MDEGYKNYLINAGKAIGIPDSVLGIILNSFTCIEKNIPFEYQGKLAYFKAIRIVHTDIKGKSIGGLRCLEKVSNDKLKILSSLITWQNFLLEMPFSGSGGGIEIGDVFVKNDRMRKFLVEKYIKEFFIFLKENKDVIYPEMGLKNYDVSFMINEFKNHSGFYEYNFSAKLHDFGGFRNRDEILKRGISILFDKFSEIEDVDFKGKKVLIQGAGKVGLNIFRVLKEKGADIIGVSDKKGGIVSDILDFENILNLKRNNKSVTEIQEADKLTNAEFLEKEADILVLAGPSNSINKMNFEKIKTDVIIEFAPSGISYEIYENLNTKKKILPDIIAGIPFTYLNSYEAIVGNVSFITQKELQIFENRIKNVFSDIYAFSVAKNKSLKMSAFMIAMGRFARLLSIKGV